MITPLPRNKRAKNPRQFAVEVDHQQTEPPARSEDRELVEQESEPARSIDTPNSVPMQVNRSTDPRTSGFANNPFAQLEIK